MTGRDWVTVGEIAMGVYAIVFSRIGAHTEIVRQQRHGWVKLQSVGPKGETALMVIYILFGGFLVIDGIWLGNLGRFLLPR